MAKVWLVKDGDSPTRGGPLTEISVSECAEKLALNRDDFLHDLSKTPRFGKASELDELRGNRHVVVEINEVEASRTGWKSGFYRAPISPQEATQRLLGRAMY